MTVARAQVGPTVNEPWIASTGRGNVVFENDFHVCYGDGNRVSAPREFRYWQIIRLVVQIKRADYEDDRKAIETAKIRSK